MYVAPSVFCSTLLEWPKVWTTRSLRHSNFISWQPCENDSGTLVSGDILNGLGERHQGLFLLHARFPKTGPLVLSYTQSLRRARGRCAGGIFGDCSHSSILELDSVLKRLNESFRFARQATRNSCRFGRKPVNNVVAVSYSIQPEQMSGWNVMRK